MAHDWGFARSGVPEVDTFVAIVGINPFNWKGVVADYVDAGKIVEAHKVLAAVEATADDALNQVNSLRPLLRNTDFAKVIGTISKKENNNER